jgi:Tol biopolymer transport system component
MKRILLVLLLCIIASSSASINNEPHLSNIHQLTFGGENAEAYFSADGKYLIFQSTRGNYPCDQIYTMKTDGSDLRKVSTGVGRTTCAYFFPNRDQILYSSTHVNSPECPAPPDRSRGYVWGLYPYDIYRADKDGKNLQVLSASSGYDAEATISPDGKKIVFTSDRDGDLELYSIDTDGKNIRRLTNSPGYDGGAFFSEDSKQIVWRGNHISDQQELKDYENLLKLHLVKPTKLELFLMNADGSNVHQVTHNGAANFCPYFHPSGKSIIFASNMNDPSQRNFDLYLIDTDGNHLRQITFNPTFDGFPMFSPDGKKLVFASNRNAKVAGETNIFIADWNDNASLIDDTQIRADVGYLASDELKGRLTGTPEARKAAEYIAAEFEKAGLQNFPGMKTPYQAFDFISGVKLGSSNSLGADATEKKSYVVGKDFIPTGFSENATLKALPVVFAGYGIHARDLKHDDYEGIDVKGKMVVSYRYGPEGDDPKSSFAPYYPLRYKAMTARDSGASALLVVADNEKDDELLKLRTDSSFGTSGIPVFSVKRSVIQAWLKMAGKEFPDRANPHAQTSFDLSRVSVSLTSDLIHEKSKSDNVLGWLPAINGSKETLVIGAHYDHLGMGIEGSLSPKWGVVHNGADDNASGVAGVLALARYFGAHKSQLNRNLLFIAFGGEELGVLGSSYFVKHPVEPLQEVVAMLNMDMIGRLRDKKLVVGGIGTSPSWKPIITSANQDSLKITMNEDGYGPSDHSMFYSKDIPVLFFFTGAHSDYHKPEDDPDRIHYDGMMDVISYVKRIAEKILELPSRPQFVRVKSKAQDIAARGFRVYLGTIPDYSEEVKGVKLTGVREGSPAQTAGIQAGDIIVEFDGKQIENIYDYTYALQQHKADEVVTVVVLRNEKRIPLNVKLERRQQSE